MWEDRRCAVVCALHGMGPFGPFRLQTPIMWIGRASFMQPVCMMNDNPALLRLAIATPEAVSACTWYPLTLFAATPFATPQPLKTAQAQH